MSDKISIEFHIDKKQKERDKWLWLWNRIEELNTDVGLKEETYKELQAKLSSKVAQCEISIRDHKALLLGLFSVSNSSTVIETPLTYCPKCKSTDIRQYTKGTDKCNNCNHAWDIYRPFKGVE